MPAPPQMSTQPGQPGQPGAGGGAPFGQTPATQPTPNRGAEAAAMQKLSMCVKLLGDALGQAGATSEVGQKILEILPKLSKMVTPGASTPASEKNNIEQMSMKNAQQNQQMQMLRQQQAKAAQGAPSPGAAPQPGAQAA